MVCKHTMEKRLNLVIHLNDSFKLHLPEMGLHEQFNVISYNTPNKFTLFPVLCKFCQTKKWCEKDGRVLTTTNFVNLSNTQREINYSQFVFMFKC